MTILKWRNNSPEFKQAEADLIQENQENATGLPYSGELDAWITKYEEFADRTTACEESGTPWGQVELALLDASLYSQASGNWNGTSLADIVRRLRNEHQLATGREQQELALYPQAA